ncbi:hypothetical protein ACK3TF_005970 [Chlorella vulgaris]
MNCGPAPAVGASCDASPHSKAKEREESSVLRPALEWLQELLSIDIASTPSLFADCWLLGRMADVLRAAWAGTVPAHRPRPQAQMPRRRADVINDFVRWQAICTELGVGRDQLPPLADVEQGRGVAAICCCIWAAADRAAALGLPMPRFGSADARSSLRCSMTREAGAKRVRQSGAPAMAQWAEHFLSAGDSPPKLPSLPLLTPRAFLGRAASPAAAGPIANLRDSTGSLKGWLCEDSSLKSDWRLLEQQGGANGGSLRPSTTAKEGAAVEAVGRASSPPTNGAGTGTAPGTATGAAAATSRTATDAPQQRWSRPLLPRLDVKAAAAAAAAEAAEQEEEEEAAAAEAAAAPAAANSPLSSPGSSTEVSPMAPYSGSSCVTSSCSASSPDCHRLTPNTLRTAALGNPLWGASPGSLAPSPAAAAAAGTQIVLRQPRFDEAGDTGAASNSMVSPPPPPQTRQLLRWEDEAEGGADADEGYGGGLLDSILSPPHLKPAHSQLLGALMHTSGDSASRAAAAAAAAAQARQRARQLELGWRVVSDELKAAPVDGAAADGGAVLRLEHPEQEEEEEGRLEQPAAAVVELAGEAAEQPGVETLCSVGAAPAGEGTEPSSNSSSSGLRRAALLLLGAVAGAAVAVAAGAVRQGKPMRHSVCRPQPVPSLAGRRLLPSEQQRALREARLGHGGGAAAALPGDQMDTITRVSASFCTTSSCYSFTLRLIATLNIISGWVTTAVAAESPFTRLYPPTRPGRPVECVMPADKLGASLFKFSRSLSSSSARGPATRISLSTNGLAPRTSSTAGSGSISALRWGAAAAAPRLSTCPAAASMSSSSGAAAAAAAATPAAATSVLIDDVAPAGSSSAAAAATKLASLEDLRFDNTFTAELPADDSEANVRSAIYSWVTPTPTGTEPVTLAASASVARLAGLDPSEALRPEFALVFSGNAPLPQTRSYSQCYGGHQFGHWAGQLGDGRAICLGQAVNAEGQCWELQLKGAGRTPYSRSADGRAVLRSSVREYIASEAMHAMGVPTTRALSLVATGDEIARDQFYNGNVQLEPGAVVCRVSQSFVRFGSFQLPITRGADEMGLVGLLADYVIKHHYPHLQAGQPNKYASFLTEVAQRTGRLVAEWHRVGFVHGVLNTDNMSILGETIDYGPYGFIERFDPDFTPEIGQWNLVQLARALIVAGLMTEEEASPALAAYAASLTERYDGMMAAKLGLRQYSQEVAGPLLRLMYEDAADYTNTFRSLSSVGVESGGNGAVGGLPAALAEALGPLEEERYAAWREWLDLYRATLAAEGLPAEERAAMQDGANPAIVPRNHVMLGITAEAEAGNYEPLHRYMAALLQPYTATGLDPAWLEPAPKKCRVGVELLSCSS